jgi:two-component sensor histidine kinase
MGGAAAELLTAFLAFVRTAHYWTVTHPELTIEADVTGLMQVHESLADLLVNDPEAARGATAQRLAEEVVLLRGEHDDREALRQALIAREESQRHQQQLINELNHRVKNSLAIVQSMASQTLRRDDVPASARDAFTARLVAFAQAHDLLTNENWDGAELSAVLGVVSEVFASDHKARIVLNGPPTRLNPGQALALSMAVHELGTNALKYGALSNDDGHVEVEWKVAPEPKGARLKLRWKEVGGPNVEKPANTGFGTRLIERGLAGDLNGEVTLNFERDGLICVVDAPIDGAPAQ